MPVLQTRTGTAVPRQENGRFTRSTPESTASGNPFSPDLASATRGANLYGFCSIEDFPAPITDLSYTHEDAQGFHDYVKQFAAPNFWYRDAGVLSWIYGEEYDNWQNTYGFDACLVEYHSGHGGMAANGVFSMPMGGSWGGTAWANSSSMRLGNEAARYLFFSTCESLRVHGGHSPLRTWGPANLGVRMIFGFETVSVDNPDYGRNFWQKWNQNNRSFSKAWLDASSADQRAPGPSVAACGASQAEAQARVANERTFSSAAASTAWWWWTWYDAARVVGPRTTVAPTAPVALLLAPVENTERRARDLADHFGVSGHDPEPRASDALMISGDGGPVLSVHPGGYEMRFGEPASGANAPDDGEAIRLAEQALGAFRLADDVDLVVDTVRRTWEAGASADERVEPAARETHVVFQQVVDGIPIVTPGVGEIRVSVDGTGSVCAIADATRRVDDVDVAPRPPEPGSRRRSAARRDAPNADELLAGPRDRLLRRLAASGPAPTWSRPVEDSTEVGYVVRDGRAVPAARQTVEVDCGAGLAKRFELESPIS